MKQVKGDVIKLGLQGKFDVIIHGCNCFNLMGAGIAKQIKSIFPMNYMIDQMTKRGNMRKLGQVDYVHYEGSHIGKNTLDLYVVNAYTQYKPGAHIDYEALRDCFKNIRKEFQNITDVKIGYPMIGAGIAGGDWEKISKIIDEELDGMDHTVVEFEG